MQKFIWVLLFIGLQVSARWADIDSAPYEYQTFDRDITVNADGTAVEIVTIQAKIINESGREIWAKLPIEYDSGIKKITVLEAKTFLDGQEYPVPENMIEDKPISSGQYGFDDDNQLSIAYPNAMVGAVVYLKFKNELINPPLDNFYDKEFTFGLGALWNSARVTINSAIPLHVMVNDPEQILDVKYQIPATNIEISLLKPIFKHIVNEENSSLNPKMLPMVAVSSIDSWHEFSKQASEQYEKVKLQPLPKLFQDIASLAATKTNLYDKINLITSELADKVQYLGDWRTVSGKFWPRSLDIIAEQKLADCKDYSIATAAILHSIGIEAYAAWVWRGLNVYPLVNTLPSFSGSNHAIVKVVDDGNVLWIDPTNVVSMSQGIFPDIAGREVLALDMKTTNLEYIPNTNYEQMRYEVNQILDLGKPNTAKLTGKLGLFGEFAKDLTAAELFMSRKSIENYVFSMFGNPDNMFDKKIKLPELTDRIVKDLSIAFNYTTVDAEYKSNAGYSTPLNISNITFPYVGNATEREGDLHLGPPRSFISNTIVKNIQLSGGIKAAKQLECNISSPWINVSRTVGTSGKNNYLVTEKVQILKSLIMRDDLKSEQYARFVQQVINNFYRTAMVFNR